MHGASREVHVRAEKPHDLDQVPREVGVQWALARRTVQSIRPQVIITHDAD